MFVADTPNKYFQKEKANYTKYIEQHKTILQRINLFVKTDDAVTRLNVAQTLQRLFHYDLLKKRSLIIWVDFNCMLWVLDATALPTAPLFHQT